MSEWWTYTLSDFLLFSPRTYFRLLELYNRDIWPLQILALALGGELLVSWRRDRERHGRYIAAILAACWIWVAWAFHLERYATINWAATYFAAAFAIEALLLAWTGIMRGGLPSRPEAPWFARAGVAILVFALVVQPAIGYLAGRHWVQAEYFGVAPDPTVTATLGVLLITANRTPWWLLVIPLSWCAISGAVQWTMGSPDALVMPIIGCAVLFLWGAKISNGFKRTLRA